MNEATGSITAKYAGYLGHCNMPCDQVQRLMWLAIVKKFLIEIGFDVSDFEAVIRVDGSGDLFNLYWQTTPDGDLRVDTIALTLNASSPKSLANVLKETVERYPQAQLERLEFVPVVSKWARRVMYLHNGRISLKAKSLLKFQNRSFEDPLHIDGSDIDNVILKGFIYEGSGTGTQYVIPKQAAIAGSAGPPIVYPQQVNTAVLFGDKLTGLIQATAGATGGTLDFLAEPPKPHLFDRVSKSGHFQCAAGAYEQSYLEDDITMNVNAMLERSFNDTLGGVAGPVAHPAKSLGHFRFIGAEKLIGTHVDGVDDVKMVYECQQEFECEFHPGKNTYTATIIQLT